MTYMIYSEVNGCIAYFLVFIASFNV